jgi:hypothetical protein
MPENTWSVITEAFDLLRAAASAISDINGADPTPCSKWTVTQVLQHAVGDPARLGKGAGRGGRAVRKPVRPLRPPRRSRRRLHRPRAQGRNQRVGGGPTG